MLIYIKILQPGGLQSKPIPSHTYRLQNILVLTKTYKPNNLETYNYIEQQFKKLY